MSDLIQDLDPTAEALRHRPEVNHFSEAVFFGWHSYADGTGMRRAPPAILAETTPHGNGSNTIATDDMATLVV